MNKKKAIYVAIIVFMACVLALTIVVRGRAQRMAEAAEVESEELFEEVTTEDVEQVKPEPNPIEYSDEELDILVIEPIIDDLVGFDPELAAEEAFEAESNDISHEGMDDVEMLACIIYQECGGDACCDNCRYMVGDVVLNRVMDERFPDTIYDVLTQPGQYGFTKESGVVWCSRSKNPSEQDAVARAYRIAEDILINGNHSDIYGQGYVWQALFKQGNEQILCHGTYFGR